jgi:uracil-DNA glycosylase
MAEAGDRLKLEASWKVALAEEFEQAYMKKLRSFLVEEKRAGKKIFPRSGVALPPSLINIFKEINDEYDKQGAFDGSRGCLQTWAEQGVLLLNAVLTVERGRAGSHQGRGWEIFTDQVVRVLNEHREHLVFLLWGSYAQKKGSQVDRSRHCVLSSPHPSPLSAHRGFFGCNHFRDANAYLAEHGIEPIDWFSVA